MADVEYFFTWDASCIPNPLRYLMKGLTPPKFQAFCDLCQILSWHYCYHLLLCCLEKAPFHCGIRTLHHNHSPKLVFFKYLYFPNIVSLLQGEKNLYSAESSFAQHKAMQLVPLFQETSNGSLPHLPPTSHSETHDSLISFSQTYF